MTKVSIATPTHVRTSSVLFWLNDTKFLENLSRIFRKATSINLLTPHLILFQLLSQCQHSLLSVRDELFQVLISQLLSSTTFTSRLSWSFQLCLHVSFLNACFAARLSSTFAGFFAFLELEKSWENIQTFSFSIYLTQRGQPKRRHKILKRTNIVFFFLLFMPKPIFRLFDTRPVLTCWHIFAVNCSQMRSWMINASYDTSTKLNYE